MLTKKNIALIAMMLVLLLITTSCGMFQKKTDEPQEDVPTLDEGILDSNLRETLVYYQDDAGYLVPVMRKIPWEEGIAKATLKVMMNTPEQQEDLMSMGLMALLPEDAEVRGMSITDGLAKVDFNASVMESNDAISEANMVQGVVSTLTEFPSIDRVQFLFDGKIVDTLKYGTEVGEPISPSDLNLELGMDANAEGAKVKVFFQSTSASQYDYLVPVTRVTSASAATLETAMEELLLGPMEIGNLRLDIPMGTRLLGVQMDDGITYINLSKDFKELAQSPQSETMVMKSIVMTARQFPEVTDVKVLVEGKEYDGMDTISTMAFANEY